MNWTLVTQIILGVFILFYLCCVYSIIEEHVTRSRVEKREKEYWRKRKKGLMRR